MKKLKFQARILALLFTFIPLNLLMASESDSISIMNAYSKRPHNSKKFYQGLQLQLGAFQFDQKTDYNPIVRSLNYGIPNFQNEFKGIGFTIGLGLETTTKNRFNLGVESKFHYAQKSLSNKGGMTVNSKETFYFPAIELRLPLYYSFYTKNLTLRPFIAPSAQISMMEFRHGHIQANTSAPSNDFFYVRDRTLAWAPAIVSGLKITNRKRFYLSLFGKYAWVRQIERTLKVSKDNPETKRSSRVRVGQKSLATKLSLGLEVGHYF